ncbi:MAG TPA: hypothetical protein VFE34_23990 [Dongiaceae bacterium]|nr:hypothetical protein [Dongiaceae bacterium]
MDAEIKEGESWLTILMAVLFVRGGISSIAMALTSPSATPAIRLPAKPVLQRCDLRQHRRAQRLHRLPLVQAEPRRPHIGIAGILTAIGLIFTYPRLTRIA